MRTKILYSWTVKLICLILCWWGCPNQAWGGNDYITTTVNGVTYWILDWNWTVESETFKAASVVESGAGPYTGDVVVQDTVIYEGTPCPVLFVDGGFGGELNSLYIPNTVVEVDSYVFANCSGLDSINVPLGCSFGFRTFLDSDFKKFYFRENPNYEWNSQWIDMQDHGFVKADVIDIAPIKCISFKSTKTRRVNLHHVDSIEIRTLQPNVEFFVMDDTIPPAYYYDESPTINPEIDGVTVQSLLFVPEEAVDAYKSAYYWRRFAGIYPKSRLDEVDQLLSDLSGIQEVEAKPTGPLEIKVEGNTLYISPEGEEPTMIYATSGRLIKSLKPGEDSATLPPGTYIVEKGGQAAKVIIR